MKTTRKSARLAGRTLKRLYEYRDLAVTAQGMEDKCRDKLISHVCINVQNTWAEFCRAYALSTVRVPVRRGGQSIVLGDCGIRTEADVVVAAMKRLKSHIYQRGTWTRRDEPPWHDPNTLLHTLGDMKASNIEDLRSAFSLGSRVFDDLPVFRNFYAHRSEDTAEKARRVAYRYGIPVREHPTAILCRTSPGASQPVILEWMDDLWATVQMVCD